MKHGNKKGKAKAAPSGKKSKPAKTEARSRQSSSAKASARPIGKSDAKARGRSGGEPGSFNNPVVAAAFRRAVKKYPSAFKRLTD